VQHRDVSFLSEIKGEQRHGEISRNLTGLERRFDVFGRRIGCIVSRMRGVGRTNENLVLLKRSAQDTPEMEIGAAL
jgi:hypothetical protein